MNRSKTYLSYAFLILGFAAVAMADDSESLPPQGPYFQVHSTDPTVDRLPLKSTDAKVRISGVTADVVITQRYRNEGTRPIEARYVFPGSTEAAVHALRFKLGNRQIDARIREKQQARLEYIEAKNTGHTSALLEQDRPNVFSMNVANILPGDEVDVELSYTERLVPTDGRYHFVFPTVVGPRYRSASETAAAEPMPSMPFQHQGVASRTAFTLSAQIDAPLAVNDVTSPSHAVTVSGAGSRHVEISLDPSGQDNDRDFLLDYRLSGSRIAGGLMLNTGDEENTFLAIVEPPKVVAPTEVSPRDYIFVVDTSGSMQGYPLETARALLRRLIGDLRPIDTFNVLTFSGDSRTLSPNSVPATAANIELANRLLADQHGSGATEIVPALRRVVALPRNPELSRTVVVVTDGYVSVEREVFELIRRNLGNTNVFDFGIGTSLNRHLIDGIARVGRGEPLVVRRPAEA
jgi:Ca-activated chloride channel family protein